MNGRSGPARAEAASQTAAKLSTFSVGPTSHVSPEATPLNQLSRLLRDRATAAAAGNADEWWRSCAMAGIRHLSTAGRAWTSDDLFALGVPEPDHPCRVGAVILGAARRGLIHPAGYATSQRPSRHGAIVRVWQGDRD